MTRRKSCWTAVDYVDKSAAMAETEEHSIVASPANCKRGIYGISTIIDQDVADIR